jgi:hypothetical protein
MQWSRVVVGSVGRVLAPLESKLGEKSADEEEASTCSGTSVYHAIRCGRQVGRALFRCLFTVVGLIFSVEVPFVVCVPAL